MSDEMSEAIARLEAMHAAEAGIARLRRLSVRIFDECGAGFGHPDCNYLAVCIGGYLHCNKCGLIEKDPSCDGTGRVLRDGATGGWVQNGMQPCVYPTDDPSEIEVYVIPASWMEAE